IEHAVIPWCAARQIAVVGYTPFGRGTFPPSGDHAVLERIAQRHGASVRQVTLAFLTRLPCLFAIPKASSAEHTRDNAGAARVTLSNEDLEAIDGAFPTGRRRRGVATL